MTAEQIKVILQQRAALHDDYSYGMEIIGALLEADYFYEILDALITECKRQSISNNNNQKWAKAASALDFVHAETLEISQRSLWNPKYE